MTSKPANDRAFTLTVERTLKAPRSVVWRCWTEPALFKQWHCPKPWRVAEADFDLRPGGRMNSVFAGPEGERLDLKGCWLEIEPEERLTFTDAFTEGFVPTPEPFMTGFVRLSDRPDGSTHMVWGARHASAEDVAKHREMGFEKGWAAATDQLDELARQVAGTA